MALCEILRSFENKAREKDPKAEITEITGKPFNLKCWAFSVNKKNLPTFSSSRGKNYCIQLV